MVKADIIPFDLPGRLVEKARRYIDSIETVLEDAEKALPLLLRAIPHADVELKQKIIMVLGSFASLEVARSLHEIMADSAQEEEIRHAASVQINVTGSFLPEPEEIFDLLLRDLKSSDPVLRRTAAFALGWEGNGPATVSLIEMLFDPDTEVQQSAVNALTNIKDERILTLLFDRLRHGPLDQKRAILYNIWRFAARTDEVVEIYLEYLQHPDENLRLDALTLLGTIANPEDYAAIYRACLSDRSERIRLFALGTFEDLPPETLTGLEDTLRGLLFDPDAKVKAAAARLLQRLTR